MRRKSIIALSCAMVLAFGTSVSAKSINLGEIVVTPTRSASSILNTPSKVDVITAQQLKNEGFVYVKDALKYIAGVSVVSNGAFGGLTNVYIRGLPTYYTKILIDGVDVSDPSNPQPSYDLANLTVNGISRIEIVQGAQSGLYGSSAIGGVINIITKTGKGKQKASYTQLVGSDKTFAESASGWGSIRGFDFYLSASRFDTGGISKMDKYNPKDNSYSRGDEKDSYHKADFYSKIEYTLSDSFKLGGVLKLYKTQNYLDNGWYVTPSYQYFPDDSAPSNNTPQAKSLRVNEHFALTKLYAKKEFGRLAVNVDAYYYQNLRYYKSAPPYYLDYKGKRWGSQMVFLYRINSTKLTAGLTQKMEKYEDSSGFKKLRYDYAAFGEIEQRFGNLKLQGVAREDKYKTFGKHFTYKLGASYTISRTDTVVKASYSTGFRAPSIYELYAPANPAWYFLGGNRNLKPEKAKTWDFGIIQAFFDGRARLSAFYFKSIVKDRIAYTTDPSTWQSTYENIKGKTVSHGFEIGLKLKPVSFVETGLNYTYTRSKNPGTGKQFARIPYRTLTGYLTVKALDNKLIATLDGRYIGKRYNDKDNTIQTGKYAVFDFTANYNFSRNLEASLSVRNIFDRFYQEVYGYSTLGRSVFAKLTFKF